MRFTPWWPGQKFLFWPRQAVQGRSWQPSRTESGHSGPVLARLDGGCTGDVTPGGRLLFFALGGQTLDGGLGPAAPAADDSGMHVCVFSVICWAFTFCGFSPSASQSCFPHLETAFRISVVNFNTAKKALLLSSRIWLLSSLRSNY